MTAGIVDYHRIVLSWHLSQLKSSYWLIAVCVRLCSVYSKVIRFGKDRCIAILNFAKNRT